MKILYWLVVAVAVIGHVVNAAPFFYVNADGTDFKFSKEYFNKFHDCICSNTSARCTVDRKDTFSNGWVDEITVQTTRSPNTFCSRYRCTCLWEAFRGYYLECNRIKPTVDGCSKADNNCWSYCLNDYSRYCELSFVGIIWDRDFSMSFSGNSGITETTCEKGCEASTTFLSYETTADTTRPDQSSATFSSFSSSSIFYNTTTSDLDLTSPSASTYLPNKSGADEIVSDDGDTNTAVIVGVVVSVLAVVILILILGYVYWKRKRNTSLDNKDSRAYHNEAYDTDTVGDYTNCQGSQGVSGSNQNQSISGDKATSSCTYAVVDPTKKTRAKGDAKINGAAVSEPCGQRTKVDPEMDFDKTRDKISNPVQQGQDYYNLGYDPTDSPGKSPSPESFFKDIYVNCESRNAHPEPDTMDSNAQCTYSVVNDTSNARSAMKNSPAEQNRIKDNPEYSYASPETSGAKTEYAMLHDPVREMKNPYNMLSPLGDDVNPTPVPSPRHRAITTGEALLPDNECANSDPTHEYSMLHEPVRNPTNTYDSLPFGTNESQQQSAESQ